MDQPPPDGVAEREAFVTLHDGDTVSESVRVAADADMDSENVMERLSDAAVTILEMDSVADSPETLSVAVAEAEEEPRVLLRVGKEALSVTELVGRPAEALLDLEKERKVSDRASDSVGETVATLCDAVAVISVDKEGVGASLFVTVSDADEAVGDSEK
jgi:hypothetical protein